MTHYQNAAAQPASPDNDGRRELGASAVSADSTVGAETSCRSIWPSIRAGRLRVCRAFSTPERAYLVLERPGKPSLTSSRCVDVLERVLLSESQKFVGIELGIAASTVATYCRVALAEIGVGGCVSRAPALLCLLARAARTKGPVGTVRAAEMQWQGGSYLVVSIALRSSALASRLSPAEQHVAWMRIEGRSLAEIANFRHTSQRTVANQLGTVFRRLGISGRPSLVALFLRPPEAPARYGRGSAEALSNASNHELGDAQPQLAGA